MAGAYEGDAACGAVGGRGELANSAKALIVPLSRIGAPLLKDRQEAEFLVWHCVQDASLQTDLTGSRSRGLKRKWSKDVNKTVSQASSHPLPLLILCLNE